MGRKRQIGSNHGSRSAFWNQKATLFLDVSLRWPKFVGANGVLFATSQPLYASERDLASHDMCVVASSARTRPTHRERHTRCALKHDATHARRGFSATSRRAMARRAMWRRPRSALQLEGGGASASDRPAIINTAERARNPLIQPCLLWNRMQEAKHCHCQSRSKRRRPVRRSCQSALACGCKVQALRSTWR